VGGVGSKGSEKAWTKSCTARPWGNNFENAKYMCAAPRYAIRTAERVCWRQCSSAGVRCWGVAPNHSHLACAMHKGRHNNDQPRFKSLGNLDVPALPTATTLTSSGDSLQEPPGKPADRAQPLWCLVSVQSRASRWWQPPGATVLGCVMTYDSRAMLALASQAPDVRQQAQARPWPQQTSATYTLSIAQHWALFTAESTPSGTSLAIHQLVITPTVVMSSAPTKPARGANTPIAWSHQPHRSHCSSNWPWQSSTHAWHVETMHARTAGPQF
jgi:hypothetical protein